MKTRAPISLVVAGSTLLLLAACGSSTPTPEPVPLSQFNDKTDRFTVVTAVGKPEGSITRNGRACDIYRIYTSGLGAGGRAATKAAEVVTGIATLGLAEAIWAPVKAGTRPQLHTVLFCFGDDEKLVDLYDKDPTNSDAPRHLVLNREAYAKPVILKSSPPAPMPVAGQVTLPGLADGSAATAPTESATPQSPSAGLLTLPATDRVPTTSGAESTSGPTDALNNASAATAEKANAPVKAYYDAKTQAVTDPLQSEPEPVDPPGN